MTSEHERTLAEKVNMHMRDIARMKKCENGSKSHVRSAFLLADHAIILCNRQEMASRYGVENVCARCLLHHMNTYDVDKESVVALVDAGNLVYSAVIRVPT